MPTVDLSVPIEMRNFPKKDQLDIPGFGLRRQELHTYTAQGYEAYTYDIPLISDGFGKCWAAVMFDRNTGRFIMLHVDEGMVNTNQRSKIKRHLSLPSDGPREAVIVKSSHQTHASRLSEKYFYDIGCHSVRTIEADSHGCHWGIALLPNENAIDVISGHSGGWTATRYRGFSDVVYDPELRAVQAIEERRFELIRRTLEFCRGSNDKWLKVNGHFTPEKFRQYLDYARKSHPNLGSADSVRELLINRGYAYLAGETLVIPSMLHWLEEGKSKYYYDLASVSPHSTIQVWDDEEFADLRAKIACSFNGPQTTHLDKDFLLLTSPAGDGQIILKFGLDKISFHEVQKGDMMRLVLETVSSIVTQNKYGFSFTGEHIKCDNYMPPFSR